MRGRTLKIKQIKNTDLMTDIETVAYLGTFYLMNAVKFS